MTINPFESPQTDPTPKGAPAGADEARRREHLNHEASIQGIGSLWILGGAIATLSAVFGLIGVFAGGAGLGELFTLLAVAAFAAATLWTGIKVRGLHPSGRIPGLVLAALGLLGFPIGTLIAIYMLVMLGSKKGAFVMSEEYRGIIERTPHIKYRTSVVVLVAFGVLIVVLGLGALAAMQVGG